MAEEFKNEVNEVEEQIEEEAAVEKQEEQVENQPSVQELMLEVAKLKRKLDKNSA